MTEAQDVTLLALEKGIKMEIDGKVFYLQASEKTSNIVGKNLLQSLAAEEDVHRKVFEEIYESVRDKQGWPRKDFKADGGTMLRTVFADAIDTLGKSVKTIPEEIDTVKTAMDMENETYDFYKEHAKSATYDAEKFLRGTRCSGGRASQVIVGLLRVSERSGRVLRAEGTPFAGWRLVVVSLRSGGIVYA